MAMVKATSGRMEVDGHDISVSHPQKLLYAEDGYSKEVVVDYFRGVAETMVPHLRGRPLTLRRFPDGIDSDGFFQKEAAAHFPEWVRVAAVPQRGAPEPVHHVVCDDAATLVYLATQACLEFHVGLSTVADLERPDVLVVDLDPPENLTVADLRGVVRDMCDRFRDADLRPYIQATGGKGFHVVAPVTAGDDFDTVRAFVRELAAAAAEENPDWLTTEQRKRNRGDRVFLDINRNSYGQTMIAPYSLRARAGAPSATPLELSELSRATPRGHGLVNMSRRLSQKTDPWADLLNLAAPR